MWSAVEWRYTFTPPIRLHAMDINNFTFLPPAHYSFNSSFCSFPSQKIFHIFYHLFNSDVSHSLTIPVFTWKNWVKSQKHLVKTIRVSNLAPTEVLPLDASSSVSYVCCTEKKGFTGQRAEYVRDTTDSYSCGDQEILSRAHVFRFPLCVTLLQNCSKVVSGLRQGHLQFPIQFKVTKQEELSEAFFMESWSQVGRKWRKWK